MASCIASRSRSFFAGASAIEVGTANFMNPAVTGEIVDYIEDYLVRHKMSSVNDLIGALEI